MTNLKTLNNDDEPTPPEVSYTVEWIAVKDLEVDPRIQRDHLDMAKVARIERTFNPNALDVITVSQRNAVTRVIIDGWHRREVVLRKGGNEALILCHVYRNLSLVEEAQMFLDLNAGSRPTVIDKFRVRITAGDPVAMSINDIVKSYGWTIAMGSKQGNIQCAGTVEKIFTRSADAEDNPNILQEVILVVTRAWDLNPDAVHSSILEGMALVLAEYPEMELDHLINRLKLYPGGPGMLLSNSRNLAALDNGRTVMAVAAQLVKFYNQTLKTKKLPAWGRTR